MKYFSIILKEISVQILWGFVIGTAIVTVNQPRSHEDITKLSNTLFVVAVILLLVLPILLRPKGIDPRRKDDLSIGAWRWHYFLGSSKRYPKVEPSDDASLLGLSEEEQKMHLALEGYVVPIRMFGIGITLIFYSLVFYLLFGN